MKRFAFCLWLTCVAHCTVTAHVLDQYLQAAEIALAPEGVAVELRLTPGVEVAERIFTMLDANRDGQLDESEKRAYAEQVRQDIVLKINSLPSSLLLTVADFPTRQAMNECVGTLHLKFMSAATLNSAGAQQLEFQNHHLPQLGTYLVNALLPKSKNTQINRQQRDAL